MDIFLARQPIFDKSKLSLMIPYENVVIEILENIKHEKEIVDMCIELKKKGFSIALDDFIFDENYIKLIKIADIIKIDFNITKGDDRKKSNRNNKKYNINM